METERQTGATNIQAFTHSLTYYSKKKVKKKSERIWRKMGAENTILLYYEYALAHSTENYENRI